MLHRVFALRTGAAAYAGAARVEAQTAGGGGAVRVVVVRSVGVEVRRLHLGVPLQLSRVHVDDS